MALVLGCRGRGGRAGRAGDGAGVDPDRPAGAHAGAFGPKTLDPTLGPRAEFTHAPPTPNTSPLDGFQHFGEIEVAGGGELTVHLRDGRGASRWTKTLCPQRR